MSEQKLALAGYVEQMALLLDLPLTATNRPAVVENFTTIAAIARLVNEFPLADEIETASVFKP